MAALEDEPTILAPKPVEQTCRTAAGTARFVPFCAVLASGAIRHCLGRCRRHLWGAADQGQDGLPTSPVLNTIPVGGSAHR